MRLVGRKQFATVAALLISLWPILPALALTGSDLHQLQYGSEFYWPDQTDCATSGTASYQTVPPSQAQAENAKIIIGIAKTDGLGEQGALIGLMVGLDESTLLNDANSMVPVSETNPNKQGDGSDYDSVGVFQQRVASGWSTYASAAPASVEGSPSASQAYANGFPQAVNQIMTPAYAAEAFFGSPPGSNAPSALSKGLQNVNGWQSMDPAVAAQHVQGSADPTGSNYRKEQGTAQGLLSQYWASSPPIPLPYPITGGQPSSGSSGNNAYSGCGGFTGSVNGCVNPLTDPGWGLARTDMGVDYIPQQPLPVRTPCDGTVLETQGAGWPGGYFLMIKLSSGPEAGKCMYIAEHLENPVPVGTVVQAGEQVATALPGYPWTEWGWAQGPQTPSTPYNGSQDGTAMPGGKAFARFMRALGAQTQMDPGPGPLYDGASCP